MTLAVLAWPWGGGSLWPAAGLGMVAAAYFGLGPGIYRKADGRLPLSTRFVLGPVFWGSTCRWPTIAGSVARGTRLRPAC